MRRIHLSLWSVLGLVAIAAPAVAGEVHFNHHQCDYRSNYDVSINDAGVGFQRDDDAPRRVFMHDGSLRVDGHEVTLSAADARSLRRYEAGMRQAVPEIAGITRAGVDIGFAAMTAVAATFAPDGERRHDVLQSLQRRHGAALREIERTLGSGQWRRDAMADTIRDAVEHAVPELVGTVTASAVKAALSGDEAQLTALQARADALGDSIDEQMENRADKLQARADDLCARLQRLHALQQQWQFRLDDGSRLQLLRESPQRPDDHEHGAAADRDVVMW